MKNILRLFTMVLFSSAIFISCKPKDSDVQANVQQKLSAMPGISASVSDGVATLTGECTDETAKSQATEAAKGVKGVSSVVNNCTIVAPQVDAAPPVMVSADSTMMNGVKDATKDFPTVNANVNDGVITLTGSIKRDNLKTLMMSLNSLKPKKIDNQLTIK